MTSAAIVGSGPNGLAAALTLAAAGIEVDIYEAADRPGGGTRSSELTLPGLIHDECSAAHPLAVDNAFIRRFDLSAHGLEWCWPEVQFSHPLDGREGAAAYRAVQDSGGPGWRRIIGPLAEGFHKLGADTLGPVLHVPRHPLGLARFGALSALPATTLARLLEDDASRALWAGVVAHSFQPLDTVFSSAIGLMLGASAHGTGWPVARGGSAAITQAMLAALERYGARLHTGVEIRSLTELRGGTDLILLDVAPRGALAIAGAQLPGRVSQALAHFRYGPAAFKVDFAVHGGVPWTHLESRRAGTVHVGGSLAEIATAECETNAGRLPERPFVLVAQQYLADRSRWTNGDLRPLWTYAHVPHGYDGDPDVVVTAIETQIERFAPGFRERIAARAVRTVQQTEAENANYVGGDIATGSTDARQLLFRPRVALNPYSLGIPGVYLCSAATPPGAGAHGMCGYNAASAALRWLAR